MPRIRTRAPRQVLEARQVPGQGPVASVLVQRGTLRVGDVLVAGDHYGRVRSLTDDSGASLQEVRPPRRIGDALTDLKLAWGDRS